jgi:hypothetical protein
MNCGRVKGFTSHPFRAVWVGVGWFCYRQSALRGLMIALFCKYETPTNIKPLRGLGIGGYTFSTNREPLRGLDVWTFIINQVVIFIIPGWKKIRPPRRTRDVRKWFLTSLESLKT